VVFVLRTRRSLLRSRPSRAVLAMTALFAVLVIGLPYTPLAGLLGFEPLAPTFLVAVAGIVVVYLVSAEAVKAWFYRSLERDRTARSRTENP